MLKIDVKEFRRVLERMAILATNSLVTDDKRTFILLNEDDKVYAYTEAGSSTKIRYQLAEGTYELNVGDLVDGSFGYHLRYKQLQDIMATIQDNAVKDGQITLDLVNSGKNVIFKAELLGLYGGEPQELQITLMMYNLEKYIKESVLTIPEAEVPQVTSNINYYLSLLLPNVEDINTATNSTKMAFSDDCIFTNTVILMSKVDDKNIPVFLQKTLIQKVSLQSVQRVLKDIDEVLVMREDVSRRIIISTVDRSTVLVVSYEDLVEGEWSHRHLVKLGEVEPKGTISVSKKELLVTLKRANLTDTSVSVKIVPVDKPYIVNLNEMVNTEGLLQEAEEDTSDIIDSAVFFGEEISTLNEDESQTGNLDGELSSTTETNEVEVKYELVLSTRDFSQKIPILLAKGDLDLPMSFRFVNTQLVEKAMLPFGKDVVHFGLTKDSVSLQVFVTDDTNKWCSLFNTAKN